MSLSGTQSLFGLFEEDNVLPVLDSDCDFCVAQVVTESLL
jgi:hypothetical protein